MIRAEDVVGIDLCLDGLEPAVSRLAEETLAALSPLREVEVVAAASQEASAAWTISMCARMAAPISGVIEMPTANIANPASIVARAPWPACIRPSAPPR
jgi:hypothetical protein